MSKKKILVVDDDPDFVDAVRSTIEDGGYLVEVAYDGQEGLDKVPIFGPDLIVLDVMMPVLNGHQACAALKKDPATCDIPVILLTAVADHVTSSSYTHRDMLASDADEYLPKPVEPRVLLERIQDLL